MKTKSKPRELDFSKIEVVEMKFRGVPVTATFDANGWPLSVSPRSGGAWLGGDEERIAHLATLGALDELRRRAILKEEADGHARRTMISTEKKRERAATFWGNDWLKSALERCPGCRPNSRESTGEYPLALTARNMIEEKAEREPAFKNHDHFKHRAQITNYRARKFLETP